MLSKCHIWYLIPLISLISSSISLFSDNLMSFIYLNWCFSSAATKFSRTSQFLSNSIYFLILQFPVLLLREITFSPSTQNLERAYLTHPFHCCAFKFPEQHDPLKHREYLINLEKFHECKNENPVTDSISQLSEAPSSRRRRRNSVGFNDDSPITESSNLEDDFFEGQFHPPVQMNRTLIADCGNLSPM